MEVNGKEMDCYIDYLDSKNDFKQKRKSFKDSMTAFKWMVKTMDTPNIDFIKYY